jgi:hypothetical protein
MRKIAMVLEVGAKLQLGLPSPKAIVVAGSAIIASEAA